MYRDKNGEYMDRKLEKIVLIGPVYPYKGGISHYTGLMARALRQKYEVQVVSYKMQYPKLLFKKEQRDYSNKTFEDKDALFLINTANPFSIIGAANKIKKMKPDLVLINWWHPYFAPCYQILINHLGRDIKKAFICHNVFPHERFPMDKLLTRMTLRKADFAVVHSDEDRKDFETILKDIPVKKNLHPTYNAFKIKNLSREEARKLLGIGEDEKVLLFFGLVRKYKGLIHLLKAMPRIIEKVPDVKLYIVGDFGDSKEEYLKETAKLGIDDRLVIRDGYVPDEEVEPYFAASDLNVCPYESATQSGILQIAFGFELPAVVTNVGGLPEVVTDNETGFVVEPFNSDALADKIIEYFNNNLEETMRENVRKDSVRFSWDRIVMTIGELWDEC